MLKHHPDKRKAAGEQIVEGDNDYFTCITKGLKLCISSFNTNEISWSWWDWVLLFLFVCYLWFGSQLLKSFLTPWRGEPSTASILPLTTVCPLRAKAKRTFLRCSVPFLIEMPDGLPKSMCPNLEPPSQLLKKWTVFTLFGKCRIFVVSHGSWLEIKYQNRREDKILKLVIFLLKV